MTTTENEEIVVAEVSDQKDAGKVKSPDKTKSQKDHKKKKETGIKDVSREEVPVSDSINISRHVETDYLSRHRIERGYGLASLIDA